MSGRRILVVEDSPTQALRLQHVLEGRGHEVTCVPSAERALDEFNRTLPDLVVVDYHLPGLQGADLCRQLRLNVGTLGIPILMLTADESPEAQRHGLDSGADDFIPKSAPVELLLLRVENLLRQARLQTEDAGRRPLFRRATVLVVGAPGGRVRLATALEEEGCVVATVADGKSALRHLDNVLFDCVLVAPRLPDMDGLGLCREIASRPLSEVPPALIAMLDHTGDQGAITAALAAGADDVVFPSTEDAVLRARLRATLRRRFLSEQNRELLEEFRNRETEALRLRAEREAAEARAALAEELARANLGLERANRQLQSQAAVTRTITDNVTSALFMVDHRGEATFLNPAAEAMTGYRLADLAGRPLLEVLRGGRPAAAALPTETIRDVADDFVRKNGAAFPVSLTIAPLVQDGAAVGAVLEVVDVTERRQSEEQQALLMAELSHRVKNTLSTVLSVANQTMRQHDDMEAFRVAFDGRLRALAATHNLLAASQWTTVGLHDIVELETAPYRDEARGNLSVVGPEIRLKPRAALSLGMAFHELATNAAKYGAFSNVAGRVEVSWDVVDAEVPQLSVRWTEAGGPPVSPPSRRGFGRTLIEAGLAYELRGKATMDFRPEGIVCALTLPLDERNVVSPPVPASSVA